MLEDTARKLWTQPAVDDPPPTSMNDWIIVGVLVMASLVEPFFRDDLSMVALAVVLGIIPVIALLWRRSNPLGAVLVAFSAHALTEAIPRLAGDEPIYLYSGTLYTVMLPYALFRWGSGRQAGFGFVFIVVTHLLSHPFTLLDTAFVVIFFMFPAEVGASVRYRVTARRKLIDQIKLQERQELPRELHDTVAHHVSAIAVRAQAGHVQAQIDPDGALAALDVIEQEASRTLTEMRSMVNVLRSSEVADLTPQPGVADLSHFVRDNSELPRITVDVSSDAGEPAAPIGSAIYRIAQESITNALRHSRSPREINISVDGDADFVRLSICDDGEAVTNGRGLAGFGVIGMKERANLLGGTLEAGPTPGRGWKVEAVLPRVDATQ